ncbi:SCO1664 family protein [Citricoccus alkalitolerans]|uniref:SCO1664 family protein n=1 Tax=Citricoccus alkalitolerans TaxID=246603 RepID=A0ABV8XV47_9MICC
MDEIGGRDGKRDARCTERDIDLLERGSLRLLGRLAHSSNETFLVEVITDADESGSSPATRCWAIYKPEWGERPLRDFPPGLYHRERAAFLLSESLGWGVVPPTVIREEGPYGVGSLQLFIDHDPAEHYFTLADGDPAHLDELRRLAVFDLVANNTDRKAGHVLHGTDGRLWGIDHGLCFAAPFKLRTVIWDFAGERIDAGLLADVAPLATEVPAALAEHLMRFEAAALQQRVEHLLQEQVLPVDPTGMRFPWPLV